MGRITTAPTGERCDLCRMRSATDILAISTRAPRKSGANVFALHSPALAANRRYVIGGQCVPLAHAENFCNPCMRSSARCAFTAVAGCTAKRCRQKGPGGHLHKIGPLQGGDLSDTHLSRAMRPLLRQPKDSS
jgi:hypothetical protein